MKKRTILLIALIVISVGFLSGCTSVNEECGTCDGTGKCNRCGGTGWAIDWDLECDNCDGTGDCPICDGTGYVYPGVGIDGDALVCFVIIAIVALLFILVIAHLLRSKKVVIHPPAPVKSKPDRRCPECGRVIPEDAEICPYCGKEFKTYLKGDKE